MTRLDGIEFKSELHDLRKENVDGFFEGWPTHPDAPALLAMLQSASMVELAIDSSSGQLIGFVTAITDNLLSAYLPLLEVRPEYRRRGVGSHLVERMLGRLSHLYMIDLVCDPDVAPFYERLGLEQANAMILRNYANQRGPAHD